MRTLADVPVARGTRVFLRADLNVPLLGDHVVDAFRIEATLPTIRRLLDAGAAVVVASHLGRPEGGRDPKYSLAPVAAELAQLLEQDVRLVDSPRGPVGDVGAGEVAMLENVRFEPGEVGNDAGLAATWAEQVDAYVGDAFGATHRAHASTTGLPGLLPSGAGLLVCREVEELDTVLTGAARPVVAVLGGAKVSDKLGVLRNLLPRVDSVLVGGGMCFTLLRERGGKVGASLVEDGVDVAAVAADRRLVLPTDILAADRFAEDASAEVTPADAIPDGMRGLDIGPDTSATFADIIRGARTVFWNGPMGVFEWPAFASGTQVVAEAIAETPAHTVVGGGDSVAALRQFQLEAGVDHVSSGGGASLEYLEGEALPGLVALGWGARTAP